MKNDIFKKLVPLVKDLLSKGTPPAAIKKTIGDKTGLKKTRCGEIYNQIIESELENKEPFIEEVGWNDDLISDKKYYYNESSKQYIVFLKKAAKNIVVSKEMHEAIISAYSNFDGDPRSINQICRAFKFPRLYLEEYLRVFGVTHDSLPVAQEDMKSRSEDELVEDLVQKKQFSLIQKFEKRSWEDTLRDAEKWRHFKFKQLDPFERVIKAYAVSKPTPNLKNHFPNYKPSNKHLIINIADIHVGLKADGRYLFFQKEWNNELLMEAMHNYASKVKQTLSERNYGFDSAVVCLGGDIAHSLTSYTDKGTRLEFEMIGESQLDYCFTILTSFFDNIVNLFPKVQVKSVQGNHSSIGDYTISKYLEAYYRQDSRLEFDTTTKRFLPFKIHDNNLFILEHGYSALYKSKLPKGGSARDTYIQNILLQNPELLQGVKNRYYISNDQHHLEMQERNQFEVILCPSIVGGDRYSDNCVLKSRQRQNVFVVDEDGVKEIVHIYFD